MERPFSTTDAKADQEIGGNGKMTNEEAVKSLMYDWYCISGGDVRIDAKDAHRFLEATGIAIKALQKQNTADLVKELSQREGVDRLNIESYQRAKFEVNGPAIVLPVTD